jgi:hypothetical protein
MEVVLCPRYCRLILLISPIVQIKSAGRKKEVLYDRDKKIETMAISNYGK